MLASPKDILDKTDKTDKMDNGGEMAEEYIGEFRRVLGGSLKKFKGKDKLDEVVVEELGIVIWDRSEGISAKSFRTHTALVKCKSEEEFAKNEKIKIETVGKRRIRALDSIEHLLRERIKNRYAGKE